MLGILGDVWTMTSEIIFLVVIITSFAKFQIQHITRYEKLRLTC
jgi:hypothetical protein